MTVVLYIVGIILFLIGISISIALHELGHLTPAKKFGVKVTHYMVGFGPTLFSFRRGETEYGIKAFPLGGFIAMPGMYPPEEATKSRHEGTVAVQNGGAAGGVVDGGVDETTGRLGEPGAALGSADDVTEGRLGEGMDDGDAAPLRRDRKKRKGRLFEDTMADAREFSNQEIEPGEEHRTFYALSVPKRLVVMFSGPLVNLVLGILIMGISLLGIGVITPTTTVQTVVECAVPASEAAQRPASEQNTCRDDDQLTPAWEAGIKPGDEITAIAGTETKDWDQLSSVIKDHARRQGSVGDGADHRHRTAEGRRERQGPAQAGREPADRDPGILRRRTRAGTSVPAARGVPRCRVGPGERCLPRNHHSAGQTRRHRRGGHRYEGPRRRRTRRHGRRRTHRR